MLVALFSVAALQLRIDVAAMSSLLFKGNMFVQPLVDAVEFGQFPIVPLNEMVRVGF